MDSALRFGSAIGEDPFVKVRGLINDMLKRLKEEVATLQKELASLAKTQADMDALREKESAAYAKDKPELEQGLEGVKLALQILREYYAKEDKSHDAAEGAAS